MNAADLMVEALASEGVEYVFGIPGDENLHFMEALRKDGRVRFVLTRHEQAAGFMAAAYGRLTGKLGVAMSTLGAGATNLATAVAHAHLAAIPMMVLTGQKAVHDNKQGLSQLVDVVGVMRPITKYAATVPSGAMLPAMVREAMMTALSGRQGPVHLELPDDVMLDQRLGSLVPCKHGDFPVPSSASVERAAEILRQCKRPLIMVGGGARANRPAVASALRRLVSETEIPFVATMMGKGVADERSPLYVGTSIMPADYTHCAVIAADAILNVGHDVMEKPSFLMRPDGDQQVIHLNSFAAHGDSAYFPDHQVIGDMAVGLSLLADALAEKGRWNVVPFLRAGDAMRKSIARGWDDATPPTKPQYAVRVLREFMRDTDIVSVDKGVHMMWVTRNYPAYEPNTMLIDHALGSRGISLPAAIAAKLVYPKRRVVVVTGDGGFMMNSQELETAVRLGLDLIVLVFNDNGLGMIRTKQIADGYERFGVDFDNPDLPLYAESFGAKGHRLNEPSELRSLLDKASAAGGVHVIDVPIDADQNPKLMQEMRGVDCERALDRGR